MHTLVSLVDAPDLWDRHFGELRHGPAHTSWFCRIFNADAPQDCFLHVQQAPSGAAAATPLRQRRHRESLDIAGTFGNAGPAFQAEPFH